MPAATPLPRRASASGREAFPLTGEGVGRRSAARGAFGRRRLSAVRGLVVLLPTETGGSGRAGLRSPSLAPRSRAGAGEEGAAGGVSASREGRESEMHRRELQRSAACDGESRPGAALLAALTVSPRLRSNRTRRQSEGPRSRGGWQQQQEPHRPSLCAAPGGRIF